MHKEKRALKKMLLSRLNPILQSTLSENTVWIKKVEW